jgi:hypothetical protein
VSTQFENGSTFENASLMLEACREAYERGGFEEARQLKGLEATSPATAYASLCTLLNVPPRDDETRSIRHIAIEALRLIASTRSLPLAG